MSYKISITLENEQDPDDTESKTWIGLEDASEAIRRAADDLWETYPKVLMKELQAKLH